MTGLLIINRHDLQWTTGNGRFVTTPPEQRQLVTRTFGGGLNGWRAADFARTHVIQMQDLDQVHRVCRWVARRSGVGRVLTLHEKDQVLAARIRDELGLPGAGVDDVLPYRDKHLMKSRVQAAGVRVPRFARASETSFSWSGPTVSKDPWGLGASSIGWWDTPDAAIAGLRSDRQRLDDVLLEERVEGEMYYCDSVVLDGRTVFSNVSQYVVLPGEYRDLDWQADLSPVPPAIDDDVRRLNERVLDALGRHDGVTHAEYFRDADGDLVFCEVAARPGGGGVDHLVRRTRGVDLIEVAVAIAEGRRPDLAPHAPDGVTVLLGLYPSPRALELTEQVTEQVTGVVSHEITSRADALGPRHATDYTDMLVLHGGSRDEALASLRAVLVRSGREPR